jgi:hypothetical protein
MTWQDEVAELLRGHTDRKDEEAILALLRAADAAELDAWLVGGVDVNELVSDMDDRLFGPDNREALYGLLARERVSDLSVAARALIIAAAQRGRTSSSDERAIVDLMLATKGAALTELKDTLDRGDDHRDLQQLIYSDLDDAERRAAVLEHIAAEASGEPVGRKVLSDIDDTLYANWKDERYPKKTVYPGVRAFYQALSDQIAFVTARPKDRPGVIERKTHETLRAFGVSDPVVLSGSFLKLHSNERIAEKKLQNFQEYARLFPEYRFVFIGDSGQGDADFGAKMREAAPAQVEAVFIHDVVDTSDSTKAEWEVKGVFFEDNYVGLAARALDLGILDAESAAEIVRSAFEELVTLELDDEQRAARTKAHREAAARLTDATATVAPPRS